MSAPKKFATRIHGALVVVDNTEERVVRPEVSACCGDDYYARWRGGTGRLVLVCLWCGQDFAEINRGGMLILPEARRGRLHAHAPPRPGREG